MPPSSSGTIPGCGECPLSWDIRANGGGGCCELRGPPVRGAFGHVVAGRTGAMSRTRVRAGEVRRLSGSVAPDNGYLFDYTDRVEPLSLDEAYLDVTVNHYNMPSATIIASDIRRRIREATGLTASAGVSVNKFLAKIASDYNKPDGLTVVTGEEAEAFVEGLKIEQFWGVGKVTADRMHGMGIHTGADLKMRSEAELVWHFGKAGHTYYLNARAIDNREVTPDRVRKSVGCENTFSPT